MNKFSFSSEKRLVTCHPDLQKLARAVLVWCDCSVLQGHRNQSDQENAFVSGKSLVNWPNSKHNQQPSRAIDLAFYPIEWDNIEKWEDFGERVMATAKVLGIKLRWGGHWNTLKDYVHFELEE